jgi:hypothetical protein
MIDLKSQTRQEFQEQISAIRKENNHLKMINSDLLIKIDHFDKIQPIPQ